MNAQKFTQKSLEAIQWAQDAALSRGSMQIEQQHLLLALVEQQGGLIPQLLQAAGSNTEVLRRELDTELSRIPAVSGSGREPDKVYVSQEVDRTLIAAEKQAADMKDAFVSVEHIFLALLDKPNAALSRVFTAAEVDKNRFLSALAAVRGNQRVTSDNPEETYDVLQKYGQDLVERARAQKLDPVIGRDSEIRNVIRILSRKTKYNPVLIGEPGVGKTAIAEGLAQRIVRGDVPENLKDR